LNDEDIRYLSKDATPVKETDTIAIVPLLQAEFKLARLLAEEYSNEQ